MRDKLKRILYARLPKSSRIGTPALGLMAFLAWVSIGADPLSSSCYGPEEAFLALAGNTHLACFVALLTIITIFIIAIGYSQVIELFPSGAGGYKVATKLLHPYIGLISGCALIVDYILTITVSVVSGTEAIFSLLPFWFIDYKLYVEAIFILTLLVFNIRNIKETMVILLPIFVGFIFIHITLIIYGIATHSHGLTVFVPKTLQETTDLARTIGWLPLLGLILHSYALGSGTYTGLEAVSNNIQQLPEPRIYTGKRIMFYMALSLSFMAGSFMFLYLLWDIKPIVGQTLNAVLFHKILGPSWWGHIALIITLCFEAGLLFIAANTGFISGPNVLANMAIDSWVPNRFRHLSNQLTIHNGLLFFGFSAFGILLWTRGNLPLLVVLYSINVFITFSLSLLSISVYWFKHQASPHWKWHLLLSMFALLSTVTILSVTIVYKFSAGGWFTLLITSFLILICLLVKQHYRHIAKILDKQEQILNQPITKGEGIPRAINPKEHTAIIFINNLAVGMHTLLSILRLFPNQFKNFVFLGAGTVDVECFRGQEEIDSMQTEVNERLNYFVHFCHQNGLPAESYAAFGTDTVEELKGLINQVEVKYKDAIFFSSHLVFKRDNTFKRFLHNQTPLILQHYLHSQGRELIILPMVV